MNLCKKTALLVLALLVLLALAACPAGPARISYEEYWAMSGTEQQAYFESFPNVEDFFNWYNEAKAAYEASHPEAGEGDRPDINVGPLLPGLGGTDNGPQHSGGAD